MNKKVYKKIILFLLLIELVSGCAYQITKNNQTTVELTPSSNYLSSANVQNKVLTPTPQTVILPSLNPEPINDEIPNQELSTTRKNLLYRGCPSLSDSNIPFWENGSVLFGTGRLAYPNYAFPDPSLPGESGIWAIRANNLISDSQLAINIPSPYASWIYVSPDGETILHIERNNDISKDDEAVFYKIYRNNELRLPIEPGLILSFKWLQDGRFKYLSNIERAESIGESREYIILDPNQANHERITEEIELPRYFFDPIEIEHGLPSGYDAIDPSGQFVLYTAMLDDGVNVLLRNINTGEILWRQKSEGIPASPVQAEWRTDGSGVIFIINSSYENGKYREIIRLNRDGQEEELPLQPYTDLDKNIVRYLTQSPDGRYIIYGLWDGAWVGKGYVIDTHNLTIGEICRSSVEFLDGVWLSDNQFVYRVLIQDGENQKHSMQILDIPSWTSQVLYETSQGYGINIFGWTPQESFPSSTLNKE